jgi:WhiB family redox-sensing transcriptional regulator
VSGITQLGAGPRRPGEWQKEGLCRREDVDRTLFFHPEGERGVERRQRLMAAKKICGACPVAAQCLRYSRSAREPYGIWGGEGEDEREAFLRGKDLGDPSLRGSGPTLLLPPLVSTIEPIPRHKTGGMVDSAPARRHIEHLLSKGYSGLEIAAASGMTDGPLRKILRGSETISERSSVMLLAVQPEQIEAIA